MSYQATRKFLILIAGLQLLLLYVLPAGTPRLLILCSLVALAFSAMCVEMWAARMKAKRADAAGKWRRGTVVFKWASITLSWAALAAQLIIKRFF